MLGASKEEEGDTFNDAASSQAKTAQIQGIMKLFAVSLWLLCKQLSELSREAKWPNCLACTCDSEVIFFL